MGKVLASENIAAGIRLSPRLSNVLDMYRSSKLRKCRDVTSLQIYTPSKVVRTKI